MSRSSLVHRYGAYGGVDDFSVKDFELVNIKNPSAIEQPYRRFSLSFNALTYNANTVNRRALVSATSVSGSVFILVAGSLGNRYKESRTELGSISTSFRAFSTSKARVVEIEAAEEEAARAGVPDGDDMSLSSKLDGTVGATSVGLT
jgi:hypothetical protein